MYYGRIVSKHWHSTHINERTSSEHWTYTVVSKSIPDRQIHEKDILEVKDFAE